MTEKFKYQEVVLKLVKPYEGEKVIMIKRQEKEENNEVKSTPKVVKAANQERNK